MIKLLTKPLNYFLWNYLMSNDDLINGAEAVIKALVDNGVEVIFGYPGGAVLPLYDAIFQHKSLKHILVRHEQAVVHAAEGYARSTGKVGCFGYFWSWGYQCYYWFN